MKKKRAGREDNGLVGWEKCMEEQEWSAGLRGFWGVEEERKSLSILPMKAASNRRVGSVAIHDMAMLSGWADRQAGKIQNPSLNNSKCKCKKVPPTRWKKNQMEKKKMIPQMYKPEQPQVVGWDDFDRGSPHTLYLESTREVVLWGGKLDLFNRPFPAWTVKMGNDKKTRGGVSSLWVPGFPDRLRQMYARKRKGEGGDIWES